jgi:hypothetical protein
MPEHAVRCPHYDGELIPLGKPSGDCYQCAGYFMMAHHDEGLYILCHGELRNNSDAPGTWSMHAWVETLGYAEWTDDDGTQHEGPCIIIIDRTQQPEAWLIPAPYFYRVTQARNVKRYTFAEMVERVLRYDSDGPWAD